MMRLPDRAMIEEAIAAVNAGPEGPDKAPALAKLQAQLDALPPEVPDEAGADDVNESAAFEAATRAAD